MLFVGALGSRGQSARPWFINLIKTLAEELELESWDEVKEELGEFLWLNKELKTTFLRVWEEVERSEVKLEH